jgi:hypothetical protein
MTIASSIVPHALRGGINPLGVDNKQWPARVSGGGQRHEHGYSQVIEITVIKSTYCGYAGPFDP